MLPVCVCYHALTYVCDVVAPEVIMMEAPNTPKCDVWSLGCTIIELVTGFPPYFDSPAMTAVYKMANEPHPPLPDDSTPELEDFLMACFRRDIAARPSAQQLMEHRWVKKPSGSSTLRREDEPKKLELSELTKSVRLYNTQGREKAKRLLADVDWSGSEPPADLRQLALDSPHSSSPSGADSTSDSPKTLSDSGKLRSSADRPSDRASASGTSPVATPKKLSSKSTKEKKTVSIRSSNDPVSSSSVTSGSHNRSVSMALNRTNSETHAPASASSSRDGSAVIDKHGSGSNTADKTNRPRRSTNNSDAGRPAGSSSAPPTLTDAEADAARVSRDKLREQLQEVLKPSRPTASSFVVPSTSSSVVAAAAATTHQRSSSAGPALGAAISHEGSGALSAVIVSHEMRKNLLFSFLVFRMQVHMKGVSWTVAKTFSDYKDFHAKVSYPRVMMLFLDGYFFPSCFFCLLLSLIPSSFIFLFVSVFAYLCLAYPLIFMLYD